MTRLSDALSLLPKGALQDPSPTPGPSGGGSPWLPWTAWEHALRSGLRRQAGAPCCWLKCLPERQEHWDCALPLGHGEILFSLSCWVCIHGAQLGRQHPIGSDRPWSRLRLGSGVLQRLALIPATGAQLS